jgi:hypothetical protein
MRNVIHRATAAVVLALLVACSSANQDPTKPASSDGEAETHEATDPGAAVDADTAADATVPEAPDAAGMIFDAAATDGSYGACTVEGVTGDCITVMACGAMTGHTSTAGHCPGPADVECCTDSPTTADNPPIPPGYMLMQQSQVTPAMTAWAVMILDDPTTYPMFSTTTQVFGSLTVLARVEWHPPDFQNSVVHRGVTLYVPT